MRPVSYRTGTVDGDSQVVFFFFVFFLGGGGGMGVWFLFNSCTSV